MKKLILIFLGIFCLAATASAAQKDFIVLLDTSEDMFDNYDQLVKEYFPEVVKEHLKSHDIFHLISFAEQPELEISQKIESKNDIELVLRRLLLLQPLGKYSDTVLAFRFLYQYCLSLPSYQSKTIIIFTTGQVLLPPSQVAKKDEIEKELKSLLQQMKTKGWDLRFVELKKAGSNQAAANSKNSLNLEGLTNDLGIPTFLFDPRPGFANRTVGSPLLTFPADLGKIGKSFSFPMTIENPRDTAIVLKLKEVQFNGENILVARDPVSLGPKEKKDASFKAEFSTPPKEGTQQGVFTLTFDDDLRAFPTETTISFQYTPGLEGLVVPLSIAGIVLLLAGLGYVVFLVVRKGYEKGKEAADAHVVLRKKEEEKTAPTLIPVREEPQTVQGKASSVPASRAAQPSETGQVRSPAAVELKKEASSPVRVPSDSAMDSVFLEKTAKESQFLKTAQDKTARYDDFKASPTSGKKDYDQFLKQTEPEERKPEVVSSRRTVAPVPVTIVNAPAQSYKMLVWTPDYVYQNTLNQQNIVNFKPGDTKTVGGTRSAYKILLASVPDAIAEVIFDGEALVFNPLAVDFFPHLSGRIENCLEQNIFVQVNEQKSLYLKFSLHISETEKVNNLLRGASKALEETRG